MTDFYEGADKFLAERKVKQDALMEQAKAEVDANPEAHRPKTLSTKYWRMKDVRDVPFETLYLRPNRIFPVDGGKVFAEYLEQRADAIIDTYIENNGRSPLNILPYKLPPAANYKLTVDESAPAVLFDPKLQSAGQSDMSEKVLSGRLGEICYKRMLDNFPIAYAWPSICAAAGVTIPLFPTSDKPFSHEEVMTTSYTGLVGPVGSGKSQAIGWARKLLGLHPNLFTELKPGSSESLLIKLDKMASKGLLAHSLLLDLDEWSFLFTKAKIENSSFASFLQSAFYKRHHEQTLGKGKEVNFDCALSIVGGIVEDQFDLCFGANTMGGLHDRFTFGLCPEGYRHVYREFEGGAVNLDTPIPVRIAPEIWEMVAGMKKANPKIGREAEIAIRVAHICASYDGRNILYAKDCESMVQAFIAEQLKIRDLLKPNAGITNDAQCANALVQWLERNVPNGEMAWERDVRSGLRKTLERLGPGVLEYSTKNLSLQGLVWYGEIANAKAYRGRKPRAYRLLKQGAVEIEKSAPRSKVSV